MKRLKLCPGKTVLILLFLFILGFTATESWALQASEGGQAIVTSGAPLRPAWESRDTSGIFNKEVFGQLLLNYATTNETQIVNAIYSYLNSDIDSLLGGLPISSLDQRYFAVIPAQGSIPTMVYVDFIQQHDGLDVAETYIHCSLKVVSNKTYLMLMKVKLYPGLVGTAPTGEKTAWRYLDGAWYPVNEMQVIINNEVQHGLKDVENAETRELFGRRDDRLYREEIVDPGGGGGSGITYIGGNVSGRIGSDPLLYLKDLLVEARTYNPPYNVIATTNTLSSGAFSFPTIKYAIKIAIINLLGNWANVNTAMGANLSVFLDASPGSPLAVLLYASNDAEAAQLKGYHYTTIAHDWLKSRLPAGFSLLDFQLPVNVNIDAENCNAYYDYASTNFYKTGTGCNNAAVDTIIYHEYAHFVDDKSGGVTNGALSEGWSDLLAAYITGQPKIADGLWPSEVLRNVDNTIQYPAYGEGEVHQVGLSWAGFAWDLRKNLITALGTTQGIAKAEELIIPVFMANSPDIPTAVLDVAVRFDDDDNLFNNSSVVWLAIIDAARKHGLYPFILSGMPAITCPTNAFSLRDRAIQSGSTPYIDPCGDQQGHVTSINGIADAPLGATFQSYEVQYAPGHSPGDGAWIPITVPPVQTPYPEEHILATWQTDTLPVGPYRLRVMVYAANNVTFQSNTQRVAIEDVAHIRELAASESTKDNPAIAGKIIAWEDSRNTADIVFLENNSGAYSEEKFISDTYGGQTFPAVSKSVSEPTKYNIVWQDYRDASYVEDIFACRYTLGGSCNFTASNFQEIGYQMHPAISGDTVVWDSGQSPGGIFYGEFNGTTIINKTQLTNTPASFPYSQFGFPAISGNVVVFSGRGNPLATPPGNPAYNYLLVKEIGEGGDPNLIFPSGMYYLNEIRPKIACKDTECLIVWQKQIQFTPTNKFTLYYSIYYTSSNTATYPALLYNNALVSQTNPAIAPAVSGSPLTRVTWQLNDFISLQGDIVYRDFNFTSQPSQAFTPLTNLPPTLLTGDFYSQGKPAITRDSAASDYKIVWQESRSDSATDPYIALYDSTINLSQPPTLETAYVPEDLSKFEGEDFAVDFQATSPKASPNFTIHAKMRERGTTDFVDLPTDVFSDYAYMWPETSTSNPADFQFRWEPSVFLVPDGSVKREYDLVAWVTEGNEPASDQVEQIITVKDAGINISFGSAGGTIKKEGERFYIRISANSPALERPLNFINVELTPDGQSAIPLLGRACDQPPGYCFTPPESGSSVRPVIGTFTWTPPCDTLDRDQTRVYTLRVTVEDAPNPIPPDLPYIPIRKYSDFQFTVRDNQVFLIESTNTSCAEIQINEKATGLYNFSLNPCLQLNANESIQLEVVDVPAKFHWTTNVNDNTAFWIDGLLQTPAMTPIILSNSNTAVDLKWVPASDIAEKIPGFYGPKQVRFKATKLLNGSPTSEEFKVCRFFSVWDVDQPPEYFGVDRPWIRIRTPQQTISFNAAFYDPDEDFDYTDPLQFPAIGGVDGWAAGERIKYDIVIDDPNNGVFSVYLDPTPFSDRPGFGDWIGNTITLANVQSPGVPFMMQIRLTVRDASNPPRTGSKIYTISTAPEPPDPGGGYPPGYCFLGGTPILLANGKTAPIEKIKVGDLVMAFDEKTKSLKPDRVKEFFVHDADEYLVINGSLKVTAEHPVYSEGRWVKIGKLKIGDKLLDSSGKPLAIKSIKKVHKKAKVYNLEVNPYHTYIAAGVVVHNKSDEIGPEDPCFCNPPNCPIECNYGF